MLKMLIVWGFELDYFVESDMFCSRWLYNVCLFRVRLLLFDKNDVFVFGSIYNEIEFKKWYCWMFDFNKYF